MSHASAKQEPVITATEADIILTRVHGLTHSELFELVRILGVMFSIATAGEDLTKGEIYRRGIRIVGDQIANARENTGAKE